MKIVLATHHFPPNYTAGTEQYVYRVACGLLRQGHAVEVVCIESIDSGSVQPRCVSDVYDDVLVHRLYFNLKQASDPLEWRFRNPELGQWFLGYLERTQPDVVHVNSGYLLGGTVFEAALHLGTPLALTLHDYWFVCPQITLLRTSGKLCTEYVPPARCAWCRLSEQRRYKLIDQRIGGHLGDAFVRLSDIQPLSKTMNLAQSIDVMARRRIYLKNIFEQVDLIIAPSQFVLDKVSEYGLHARRAVYLPFGLEHVHASNGLPLRMPSKSLRVGYLGQFAPHKGVHILLDAFRKVARHHSSELVLHGRISDATAYERKLQGVANSDSAITFAGPYPNANVGEILNALDVIVVPSIWYENRPTVIVEALATRTPVIASRLGGMAELIHHEKNGLLFEAGNSDSLAIQLQRLIDEPALLPQLRNGIEPVPEITDEIATLAALFEEIVATAAS